VPAAASAHRPRRALCPLLKDLDFVVAQMDVADEVPMPGSDFHGGMMRAFVAVLGLRVAWRPRR
jgi:hypothetical protein